MSSGDGACVCHVVHEKIEPENSASGFLACLARCSRTHPRFPCILAPLFPFLVLVLVLLVLVLPLVLVVVLLSLGCVPARTVFL